VENAVSLDCPDLEVSLASRGPLADLVSAVPPAPWDPPDWVEHLVKLDVRDPQDTMEHPVVMDLLAPRETVVRVVTLVLLVLLGPLAPPEVSALQARLVIAESLVLLVLLALLDLQEVVVLWDPLVVVETRERLERLAREATRDTEDSLVHLDCLDLPEALERQALLAPADPVAQGDLLVVLAQLVRMA